MLETFVNCMIYRISLEVNICFLDAFAGAQSEQQAINTGCVWFFRVSRRMIEEGREAGTFFKTGGASF